MILCILLLCGLVGVVLCCVVLVYDVVWCVALVCVVVCRCDVAVCCDAIYF